MANYDRGVYEPSDEVRVFDGSEEEDDVEGSRLPLVIVLALLVVAMFAGLIWLAYTQGVARGRGETPVLTAAAGPERVAPPANGAGTVPYQGFKIYEQPAPPDDSGEAAASPPKSAAETPVPKAAPEAAQTSAAKGAMTAPPAPAKLAPAPAAPAKSVAGLIQQANSEPPKPAAKPVTAPPAMKQAMLPPPAASTAATGAPRQLGAPAVPAPPKVAAATPSPPAAKPATGGGYALQIGSYKSQAEAAGAWNDYKRRHAALLAGYSDDIQQADLGEKGTWYRLRVAGFADREVAVALCERLKADGGACILGR